MTRCQNDPTCGIFLKRGYKMIFPSVNTDADVCVAVVANVVGVVDQESGSGSARRPF